MRLTMEGYEAMAQTAHHYATEFPPQTEMRLPQMEVVSQSMDFVELSEGALEQL